MKTGGCVVLLCFQFNKITFVAHLLSFSDFPRGRRFTSIFLSSFFFNSSFPNVCGVQTIHPRLLNLQQMRVIVHHSGCVRFVPAVITFSIQIQNARERLLWNGHVTLRFVYFSPLNLIKNVNSKCEKRTAYICNLGLVNSHKISDHLVLPIFYIAITSFGRLTFRSLLLMFVRGWREEVFDDYLVSQQHNPSKKAISGCVYNRVNLIFAPNKKK